MKTRAVAAVVILLLAAVAVGGVLPGMSSLSVESIKFSEPIKISSKVPASRPVIALDGRSIYVAWAEGSPTEIVLRRATIEIKDGKPQVVWEPALKQDPVNISETPATISRAPALAVDAQGILFVVWDDDLEESADKKADVWLRGVTFDEKEKKFLLSGKENLSRNAGVSQKPTIAVGGPGTLFVAWSDNTRKETNPLGVFQILLRRLSTAGEAISASDTFIVSKPDVTSSTPAIAADKFGRSFVAWEELVGGINFEIAFRNSAPYAPTVNVSKSPGRSQAPAMVIDRFGKLTVIWEGEEDRFGKSEILISSSADVTADFVIPVFTRPFNISGPNSPGTSREPALAVDGTGTVFVVWSDDTAEDLVRIANFQILFRRSDQAFAPPINISRSKGNARTPAIAVDGDGNLFIAWAEDDREIRFSAALKAE